MESSDPVPEKNTMAGSLKRIRLLWKRKEPLSLLFITFKDGARFQQEFAAKFSDFYEGQV